MMFVEMLKPGTLVAGFISASALLLFIAPAFLLGLASWWEVLAIGLGIVLLAVEVFVLPGFGVPGIAGLLLLLWGLVGTFSPQGSGMFSPGFMQSAELSRLLWATLMVLGSLLTAGLVVWLVVRQFGEIPLFRKLVLTNEGDVTPGTLTTSDMQPADTFVSLSDEGITLTRMTPVGRVEIRGRIVDCVSDASLLPAGQQVHVSSVSGIRIGVSPGPAPASQGGMQAEGGADAGSDGTGQGPSERS
jgi:membrane-bound serine protease (ClpP class)